MQNSDSASSRSTRIQKLDPAVSNRIAAGEVIQRPSNALKELLENSLDAGATNIQILVKDGGLTCLQIQDNGCGIEKDDLPLVCERFATSKLNHFDDLKSIHTFGFRGEALASMSYVAKVTITSRSQDSTCAYKAYYLNGKLEPINPGSTSDPQPCAGNQGTQIIIADMFYNTPLRKNALTSPNTEYLRILDIANRYAIHRQGVSISCKKSSSAIPDLVTNSHSSTIQKISQLYKNSLASDLIEFKHENTECKFKANGYISNSSCSNKRAVNLLFINHRSVSSSAIKTAIDAIYAPLLLKGHHPFIYLSLEFPPDLIDVNVHPTKREVFFYDQEKVVYCLASAIKDHLENANNSRTIPANLLTKNKSAVPSKPHRSKSDVRVSEVLPQSNSRRETSYVGIGLPKGKVLDAAQKKTLFDSFKSDLNKSDKNKLSISSPAKKQDNRHVRTDSRIQTLHSFYSEKHDTELNRSNSNILSPDTSQNSLNPDVSGLLKSPLPTVRKRVHVKLNSVLELIEEFKARSSQEIKNLIKKHVFVGCVDTHRAAIQSEINLFMVDYSVMSRELFYQLILIEFCNFTTIELHPPAPIAKLIKFAFEKDASLPPLPKEFSSQPDPYLALANFLISRREMLEEYFLLTITPDGNLSKLPVLVPKYCPPAHRLPRFLARLGSQVNWNQEKACFETLARELAELYQTDFNPAQPSISFKKDANPALKAYYHSIQHQIFPMFKKTSFYPPSSWMDSGRMELTKPVLKLLADLPGLYKVFERC